METAADVELTAELSQIISSTLRSTLWLNSAERQPTLERRFSVKPHSIQIDGSSQTQVFDKILWFVLQSSENEMSQFGDSQ